MDCDRVVSSDAAIPLSRATITYSSRVMLIAYPVFAFAVGVSYILGPPSRYESASFEVMRSILPMNYWGVMFVALSVIKVASLLTRRRRMMVLSLCVSCAICSCWTFCFAASALLDIIKPGPSTSSLNLVWLWMFVTVAHVASLRSLTRDTVA